MGQCAAVDEGKEVTLNYFLNVFGDSGCQAEYTAIFGGFILQVFCKTREYMGASKPHPFPKVEIQTGRPERPQIPRR